MSSKNHKGKSIFLRVMPMRETRDAYRGIAKIHITDMKKLGLEPGDIIIIRGSREAAAKAWPADIAAPPGIIQVDGLTRENAGVSVDEYVEVYKANAKNAEEVLIAPMERIQFEPVSLAEYLKRLLIDIPITLDSKILIRQFTQAFPFVVVSYKPRNADAVVVTPQTRIRVQKRPVEAVGAVPRVTWEDIGDLE